MNALNLIVAGGLLHIAWAIVWGSITHAGITTTRPFSANVKPHFVFLCYLWLIAGHALLVAGIVGSL